MLSCLDFGAIAIQKDEYKAIQARRKEFIKSLVQRQLLIINFNF